ncbi:MAG: GMP/IMP nucleotidase [Immundisolibacter sp.]|uniref:GMP/IMP nucleotidase n=1 Tax=Immundisolibacter sp. TaxID=1934948 RepID=UPI003D0CA539
MIDWTAIDTVLLDMDGTLLDLHYDNAFWFEHLPRTWGARRGLDVHAAREAIHAQAERRRGTLDFYCMAYWSELLELDVAALNTELAHLIGLRPQVPEFLDWLLAAGKRRVLVTNSHRSGLDFKLARTGLDAWLDTIVCAHDLAAPKEDPAFWPRLQDLLGFDPARTLLVDDNAHVLRAARDYGIGHVLAVAQPDSKAQAQHLPDLPMLLSFGQVLPQH